MKNLTINYIDDKIKVSKKLAKGVKRMSKPIFDVNKIRLERARLGKSITQLAAETKLSPKTISRIEQEKTTPRLHTVGKIAAALGKDIEDFLVFEKDQD